MSWARHELSDRPLFVWAPGDTSRRYPAVYVLHAHMRSAPSWFNVEPFERSYPEEVEALAPAAVVVLVDGWTELGGGQWSGPLASYLRDQVVPFVDEHYPTNGLRALQGKSSGGYGALVHALERPDLFHACAAHSPDALFEVTVARDFAPSARALRDGDESSLELLVTRSLADAFSGGELPFDAGTTELVPEVWARWLERDPVRLVARHADAARSLRGVWLDVGDRDDYYADLGVEALRRALEAAGARVRWERFPGGHRGLSWRYPLSLAWLVESLSITR